MSVLAPVGRTEAEVPRTWRGTRDRMRIKIDILR